MQQFATIGFVRAGKAYCAAVSAAALCFSVINAINAYISPGGWTFDRVFENAMYMFATSWIFVSLIAAIPYIVGVKVANHLHRRDWQFFIAGAMITAICTVRLMDLLSSAFACDETPYVLSHEPYVLPIFAFCGFVAGLACWLVLGEKKGQPLEAGPEQA